MRMLRREALPAPWLQLIELCRVINFGYIEDVEFRDGCPATHGVVVKTVMPGPNKDNGPGTMHASPLRPQWFDVFAVVSTAPVVRVRRIDVAHGTPLKLHVQTEGGAFCEQN